MTATFDQIDELVAGSETTTGTVGKHFVIKVPNFNNATTPAQEMCSYLRLGASPTDLTTEAGQDLAEKAIDAGPGEHDWMFDDDERYRGEGDDNLQKWDNKTDQEIATGLQDEIDNGERAPGHLLTPKQRQAETARLFSKGGWRDHSDGNRITTTQGDKVEVIRGNYKLVVLGRQDDPGNAAGLDLSGNNLIDYAHGHMPGSCIRTEWVRKSKDGGPEDGGETWKIVNQYINGVIETTEVLDKYDYYWGREQFSTTGQEGPTDERPNPHIKEKTWASKIESYTGSEDERIPSITEETWAESTNSLTDVHTSYEKTRVRDHATSITEIAGAQTEVTSVGGASTSVTNVGAAKVEATHAGTIFEETITALHAEFHGSLVHADIEAAILAFSLFLGGKIEIDLGASLTISRGPSSEYRTKKDRAIIKDMKTSLTTINTAIKDDNMSLEETTKALKASMLALQVSLGI